MKIILVGLICVLLLLVIFGLSYDVNGNQFQNQCFARHGHIEMFEDGRIECKYPLSMP